MSRIYRLLRRMFATTSAIAELHVHLHSQQMQIIHLTKLNQTFLNSQFDLQRRIYELEKAIQPEQGLGGK